MKKSRIIALFTAAMMIMSVVPAFANGYFVDETGTVFEKDGVNLVSNPGFEEGLTGLTTNSEYYEVSQEAAHSGDYSLKAIKSTKGEGAITAYFTVSNPSDSYYLSFWYKNVDKVARRPRVTFAFTDADKNITTDEATNAWIEAGTASNDQDMAYSKGEWVQYSTVINGTGATNNCAYVLLNIYGLTKDVTYVDDFEVYSLAYSSEYGDAMAEAVEAWGNNRIPSGPLTGFGTLDLPRETGVDGILVEWTSSSDAIDAATGDYSSQEEQVLAILTARLYAEGKHDEVFFEFEYPYIVQDMFGPYIEWIGTEVFEKLGTAVSGDLSLPTSHNINGYYPATITWSATDAIAPNGAFTAPEVTKYVDLTATIECNGKTATTTKRIKALGGNLIPDGLEMYYDFETKLNNKGFVYDNAQKEYNADTENVTLIDGYANFNGGTIILPSNYPEKLKGSYSVSMWVKLSNAMATSGGMYRFFDFGGGTYTSQFLRYVPAAGELSFMDRETAGNGSNWAIDVTADIGKAGWSLVTFTYDMDGGGAALATAYVNGVEVANSGNYTALTRSIYTMNSSSNTGYIGRTQWNNADNPDYLGYMDDVRIYSRVLTQDEITTLYEETRPTITAPVTIKYEDIDGNSLMDDVVVSADVDTTYDVPASYKSVPSSSDGQYRHIYKYVSAKSTDSITVNENPDKNICTLVFQLEKQPIGDNLITNPGFEEGVDGWTSNNAGSLATISGWVRTTEVAHEGNYSLKRNADVGSANASNFGTYIPIETGKKYNFSFWEYCDSEVGAGSTMMSAVCITSGKGATNNSSDHLLQYGGYSSWVNDTNKVSPRDVAYGQGWNQRVFTFDTTGATNANFIFVAYAWSAGSVFCVDDFVLEEVTGEEGEDEPGIEGEKIPVIIKYLDTEGNKIQDDYTAEVAEGTLKYTVPANLKNLQDKTEGSVIYKYTLLGEEFGTKDSVEISILQDNICTLVYDVIKADKNSNLMVDGSFEDADGNFSWGTWQSPSTSNYFKDKCEDWFYQVNRDTNASALYLTGLAADDYALGTRWNDGTDGLCSMANFVPVEKGKTYIVSYDYKHKNPSAAQKEYISTSFASVKSMTAGMSSGANVPANVSTEWQTNTFTITAPADGFIYFHFSWLGESNNGGNGPFWYFDNFEVLEVITFENEITYSAGYAEILAEDGTTGYLVQAQYDSEGALVSVVISDELTLYKEEVTKVAVTPGAKLMLVKDLVSLEPLAPSIIAE